MPAGVVVANAKENFVFGNRKMAEILGYGAGGHETVDYTGWDLRDSRNKSLTPAEMPMARALRKGETLISEEMYLYHQDGEKSVVSVNAAPIIGEGGEIVGGVLAFEDITRRVDVEANLRKSEERLRLMSEGFTDYAIFMSDVEGRVFTWNTGAESIFGYTAEEIIGRSA